MANDKVKGLFEGVLDAAAGGKESKLESHSRRVWLQNFAAVSATGAVLWACGSKKSDSTATPGCQAAALSATDTTTEIAGLNAALGLENEAINVYTAAAGLDAIWSTTAHAFAPTFKAIALQFVAHHTSHANALSSVITTLGGTPVKANAAADDLKNFPGIAGVTGATGLYAVLCAAAERELNAAKAYYGLATTLKAQNDANLVASIAPDESAHYGVLIAAAFVVSQTSSPVQTTLITAANIVPSAFAGDAFKAVAGLSIRTGT